MILVFNLLLPNNPFQSLGMDGAKKKKKKITWNGHYMHTRFFCFWEDVRDSLVTLISLLQLPMRKLVQFFLPIFFFGVEFRLNFIRLVV